MSDDQITDGKRSQRDLCVVLEIELSPESDCPLARFSEEVIAVRHQLVGNDCHTDATVRAADCGCVSDRECTEVVHTESNVQKACPCSVFGEFGCVPELIDTTDDRMIVETYLTDRELLTELVAGLNAVTEGLRLRQLKRMGDRTAEQSAESVTLDLVEVTEKQREAVTKAVAAGYYDSPRETPLGELADELDISKSALTQRLNGVESKLATAAFAAASDDL